MIPSCFECLCTMVDLMLFHLRCTVPNASEGWLEHSSYLNVHSHKSNIVCAGQHIPIIRGVAQSLVSLTSRIMLCDASFLSLKELCGSPHPVLSASHTFLGVSAPITDAFLMHRVGDAVRCRVHGHATWIARSYVLGVWPLFSLCLVHTYLVCQRLTFSFLN
jgi:hypothetical protein